METTKRKRGWPNRAVPILLAAAMVLQISAGGLMARAAAPDETGTGTAQEEPASGGSAPQAREAGENLLTNGDFSQGQGDWKTRFGSWSFSENNAKATISTAGADYSTLLEHEVQLEANYTYTISITLTTTVDRKITADVGDKTPREFTSETITANQPTTVSYDYESTASGTKTLAIYLGLQNNFPGEHTVTITNVKIIKQPKAGEDTRDGVPIDDPEGNLLKNGNFANKGADWEGKSTNTDIYFNTGRTVFYVKANAADWTQGLKQPVALDGDAVYRVTIHINSTQPRTIGSNLLDDSTGAAFTERIGTGDNVITFDARKATRDSDDFYLYLGLPANDNIQYPHSVVITGISIVPKPLDDTENDQPYDDVTSIKNIGPSDAFALPGGNWLTRTESGAQATFDQSADGGMTVRITNSGSRIDHVRFGKYIDLKARLTYTLSFDVVSDKERSFNVSITDSDGVSEFDKPIAVEAGVPRHVVLRIPPQETDSTGELFRFYLGKYAGEPGNNVTTITFSNIKLEVSGYREKAELIDDGDFSSDLGGFVANTATEGTTITARSHSVVARIAGGLMPASTFAAPRAGGNTLTRTISGMEAGAQYEVSFVAGAVKPCTLSVAMPDGQTQEYHLTSETKAFSYSFTADRTEGDLAFDFGTDQNTICLDTVRLDVRGYTKAAGIDTAASDISELTNQEPPVITEMAMAAFGQTVALRFPHINGEYRGSITGITLDGQPLEWGSGSNGSVSSGDYYISRNADSSNWYYIYLKPELFAEPEDGDRATYEIVVKADYYADNTAHQIVYKPDIFNGVTLNDDFAGEALNTNRWGYQEGNGTAYGLWGWGNNEQQWYTRDNVKVEDGVLKITAGPCSGEVADHEGSSYHSGRIWTKVNDKGGLGFAQTYGRFEAKIKLPAGEGYQGLWPAFWLLPAEGADYYGGWPVSGEIDIMEARGREPYTMDGTLHFGSPGNDSPIGDHYGWEDQSSSIAEYHIYSVDWTPTCISFQVDGHEYVRYDSWWSRADGEPLDYAYPAPFDRPFYIILNMAVGGEYDGYRSPDMSVLPADMLVDYVRVYQYNDSDLELDEIVDAPEVTKETIPEDAKTSISDPTFNTVNKTVLDGGYDRNDKDGWYLLTLSDFGGQANYSKVASGGDTFLKVDVTNPGSAAHAVQLIQHLELYRGNWYTLSFDAYADQGRNITAKAAAALGTAPRHFEYTFQMRSPTNVNSRLEINLGGATGPVYIGNVVFKAADGQTVDPDVVKTPLESGEGIYNGRFDLGAVDRLAYWRADGGEVVKEQEGNACEYRFKAGAGGATLTQKGIQLLPTDSYRLAADITGGTVTYAFKDAAGNDILTGTLSGAQTVTIPAGARYDDAQIVFTLTGGTELDNISLVRTTFNNVDYEGKDAYPLFNGGFEAGTEPWETWNSTLNIGIEGSKVAVLTNIGWGATIYDVGMAQRNVHLYGGYTYQLSFRAKTNGGDGTIGIRLGKEDGIVLVEEKEIKISGSWETYTYTANLSADADLDMSFFFANLNKTLYLDDVEVKMLGAPEKPGELTPDSYNRLGEDIAVSLSGSAGWIQSLVPILNGEVLSAGSYRLENGRLVLDHSLFRETGEYTLSARAEDYADSRQVAIRVYPANGDLIFNGGVENGGAGWEQYAGGSKNSVTYANGQMTAHYAELTVDNGSYVPWGIQWNQKITVPADGGYTLRFTASADVDRYIMVGLKDSAKQMVRLEKGTQECTVSLNLSAGAAELQFWMGAVNPDRENGYFTSADIPFIPSVYSAPHSVSLSNVSLLPRNARYTSITLTGSTKVALGGSATITAALTDESGQAVSGTVRFYLDDRQLASANNRLTLGRDVLASAGTYAICAVYDGDGGHFPARKMFTVTVTDGSETGGGSSGAGGGYVSPGSNVGSGEKPANPFVDVPGDEYYYDAVLWATANGITTGTDSTHFSPSSPCTRAQIVTFLWRASGRPSVEGVDNPFVDVNPAETPGDYYAAILWAVSKGITAGTDDTHFSPNAACTRAQAMTFLWRSAGCPAASGGGFSDVDGGAYYADAVGWAVAKGVTTGTGGGRFSPDATCIRAQIVTFLYRDKA